MMVRRLSERRGEDDGRAASRLASEAKLLVHNAGREPDAGVAPAFLPVHRGQAAEVSGHDRADGVGFERADEDERKVAGRGEAISIDGERAPDVDRVDLSDVERLAARVVLRERPRDRVAEMGLWAGVATLELRAQP